MKTNVQTFCHEFSEKLDPFASRLSESLSSLAEQGDDRQLNNTVLHLREVQQRLSTLQDKIGGQQAFLLIFGPLKSGKSTLMNAISGAYVSEVSSLPAYPAPVYVKHGKEKRFEATTYEGKKRTFEDNLEMAAAVQQDHARLASAILEVERAGENFDPKQHYPEAIRRMDIEAPAENLEESGSVLVDTPGLYSRMKFGYDLMTRDFRDTAACAIFVVKTDNLFFEKVFEEFEDLLSSFNRIFLVSNIDTTKQDLKPDGTLEPSLESRDPEQVIEAFRSLSMSAALREAIDEGRINIYPIDLLRAAAKRLRERASAEREESVAAEEEANLASDGFDRFLDDLTGYLNSSDYLHDFMYDSLRVASDLNRETGELVSSEAAERLRENSRELQHNLARDRERLRALNNLDDMDWSAAFEHLNSEKDRLLGEMTSDYTRKLSDSLQASITEWMQNDESWSDLLDRRINDNLERAANEESEAILKQLRALIDGYHGGARFTTSQLENFNQAGLRMGEIVPQLVQKMGENVDATSLRLEIKPEDIPLKRTFSDVMLLRNRKQSHSQFFGAQGNEQIPALRKQKRLAGTGEQRLKELVNEFVTEKLPNIQKDYVNKLLDRYVSDFVQTLQQDMNNLKTELNKSVRDAETTLEAMEKVQTLLDHIKDSTDHFGSALSDLRARYGIEDTGQPEEEEQETGNGNAMDKLEVEEFLNLDENYLANMEEESKRSASS